MLNSRHNDMTKLLHNRGSVDQVQLIRSVVSAQIYTKTVCEETISALLSPLSFLADVWTFEIVLQDLATDGYVVHRWAVKKTSVV